MTDDDEHLIRRMAMLLDGCLDLLDEAAYREERRERGKPLRQITMQQRAKAARELVAEAEARLGEDAA